MERCVVMLTVLTLVSSIGQLIVTHTKNNTQVTNNGTRCNALRWKRWFDPAHLLYSLQPCCKFTETAVIPLDIIWPFHRTGLCNLGGSCAPEYTVVKLFYCNCTGGRNNLVTSKIWAKTSFQWRKHIWDIAKCPQYRGVLISECPLRDL